MITVDFDNNVEYYEYNMTSINVWKMNSFKFNLVQQTSVSTPVMTTSTPKPNSSNRVKKNSALFLFFFVHFLFV